MDITAQKIQEIIMLLQRQFPGWQSFADPKFNRVEVDYKQKLSTEAKSLLAPKVFEPVFNQPDDDKAYETLVGQIEAVGHSANLLYLSTPAKGDLNILYVPELDKPTFCRAFFDLLHGEGRSDERLGRYLTYVEEHQLPSKWTFPTYYLFLCNPNEDIFIKPESTRNFFDFIGEKDLYKSTPTAERYTAFQTLFHDLKSALSDYGPRDMIDIHSLVWVIANNIPTYWKIAPGESAWQWDACLNRGFIAIGWDELGDISGLSKKEFKARNAEVIEQNPQLGWSTKGGQSQVWQFAQIEEGDRIVANRGQSEVVGIGTVTGPYYYEPDADEQKHRLPVQWDDTTPRNIQALKFKWVKTLLELEPEEFDAIAQSPKIEQDSPTQTSPVDDKPMQVAPDCPFNHTTFDLLSKLHYTPKKSVYDDHKQDFKSHLEEPFQQLMQEVAAQLPAPIADLMETRSRIFARILKNDWGQGGAWDFYWGAFYPKGGKRTEDAQLFLWMSYERLECGFYIGQYGSEQRHRFLENCRTYQADLAERLQPTLDREGIVFGSRADIAFRADGVAINRKGIGFSEWIKDPNDSDIHVAAVLSKEQVLSKSKAELAAFIREIYEQVFPLVQLATLEEPMAQLQEYLEPAEDVIETHPVYTLGQCAADTSLDEGLLQTWVNAIERKGQAILYGPPGTGKTFLAEHLARHLLSGGDGFSALVQFHPAYTYEDFIQGIRPKAGKNGGLEYPVEPGRFLKFCEQARTRKDTCILIIDEINRANLAQVFGELMYLLEYRDKAVELAGGASFKIPNNVRIIGTMNTADRSIALVDHALRRRFAFLPLYPDMNVLRQFHAGTGFAVDGLVQILTEVNRAIGDRQYELGTSFFLRQALSAELPAIWQMEIEPYLEEYFFDRPEQVEKFRWTAIQSQLQL